MAESLNILLLLLLHYLKIYPFFIYKKTWVYLESCVFGIIYRLLQGDDVASLFITIILTYVTIVGLAIMFRIVLKKQYLSFQIQMHSSYQESKVKHIFSYEKNMDCLICFILSIIPIFIFGLILLYDAI